MKKAKQKGDGQGRELEKKLKDLSRVLRQKEKQLMEAEKLALLGQLVAGIAHEINTPLGALKSNNDLFIRYMEKIKEILFNPQAPAEIRDNATLLQLFESIDKLNAVNKNAGKRIAEIVNGVRRYARHDEVNPVNANLHEILDNTLSMVHHEVKNRIQVHREYLADPQIFGFPGQLSQVFLNLLVNASQAIPDKGEISIKTYNRQDNVVVEIRDSGAGIPEDKQERIFEAGFTTKENGMGMGLALVLSMVEAHRGKIELESAVGVGTTFRIILPGGRDTEH